MDRFKIFKISLSKSGQYNDDDLPTETEMQEIINSGQYSNLYEVEELVLLQSRKDYCCQLSEFLTKHKILSPEVADALALTLTSPEFLRGEL